MREIKGLSLFSGIGGLDLAAQTCGIQTVAFCEIEKFPASILKKRFPNIPVLPDVREVDGYDYRTVDVVYGGFPCQDLSVAGKQTGLKDIHGRQTRSGLWFEMSRIIGGGDLFASLLKMFAERLTLRLTSCQIIWKVGVTKSGRRYFLQARLARRIEENGCLSSRYATTSSRRWMTPQARDWKTGRKAASSMRRLGKRLPINLNDQVQLCGRRLPSQVCTTGKD